MNVFSKKKKKEGKKERKKEMSSALQILVCRTIMYGYKHAAVSHNFRQINKLLD